MRKILYFFVLIQFISCTEKQKNIPANNPINQNQIQIEINENIETIGIILNLSELGDFILSNSRNERNYEFTRLIRNKFKDYKNHQAVLKFNKLNELNLARPNYYYYGLSFSKLPEFKLIYPKYDEFYTNEKFNKNKVDSILNDFDISIRNFYKDAKLKEYFDENKIIYKKIATEIQNVIPKKIISVMEQYFGQYENGYVIIPSPTIPNGWNFGPEITTKLSKTFYHLSGPSYDLKPKREDLAKVTDKDSLGFDDKEKITELAIHEFGHSFVRFLDKNDNKKLIEQLSYLNTDELKENLKKIGEGTEWSTGFEEHLVRASEIMVWKKLGNQKIADEKLKYEREKEGLLYIYEFVDSLEKYERKRDEYITLEIYFTELISDLMNIKNK